MEIHTCLLVLPVSILLVLFVLAELLSEESEVGSEVSIGDESPDPWSWNAKFAFLLRL
jgi:hypothetical protein